MAFVVSFVWSQPKSAGVFANLFSSETPLVRSVKDKPEYLLPGEVSGNLTSNFKFKYIYIHP